MSKNKFKKSRGFLLILFFALALLVPLGVKADKEVNPEVGSRCSDEAECVLNFDGVEGSDLTCSSDERCVPKSTFVKIGTWCDAIQHCDTGGGGLDLTCDTENNICVASVAQIACADDTVDFNTYDNPATGSDAANIDIGWGKGDSTPDERCATGLFCDTGDTGDCENDFGQGAVPTDKLGETADDIRDQIRNIINIALGFLGVAGVIVTIYGGALWMSAAGDDEKVGKAKKTIVSGLIGLVIIGIAWTIVSYVLTVTQDIA